MVDVAQRRTTIRDTPSSWQKLIRDCLRSHERRGLPSTACKEFIELSTGPVMRGASFGENKLDMELPPFRSTVGCIENEGSVR